MPLPYYYIIESNIPMWRDTVHVSQCRYVMLHMKFKAII